MPFAVLDRAPLACSGVSSVRLTSFCVTRSVLLLWNGRSLHAEFIRVPLGLT
jgi:hypothetical protein